MADPLNSKERRAALQAARLYGILDLGYLRPEEIARTTSELIAAGVSPLQLRAKSSSPAEVFQLGKIILPLCRAAGVPLIINDHPEVARDLEADGVHVGQDDLPLAEVRAIVGPDLLIGLSTHSIAQLTAARDLHRTGDPSAPDYLGFGPLFATQTKPDYQPIGTEEIATIPSLTPLPVFCIGGINLGNLPTVLQHGAQRVVIVSDLLLAPDRTSHASRCLEVFKR